VRATYALLLNTGEESVVATLGRATLRLTELLKECPYDEPENMNCFLIALENPLLLNPHAFHIGIERLLTGILSLPSAYRVILFGWFRSYESAYFGHLLKVFQSYLSYALTNKVIHLDPSPVTLVLKSLYDCNNSTSERIVPNGYFYNDVLEKSINIISEYDSYVRNQLDNPNNTIFNFCRFPFLLNLTLKHQLVSYDVKMMQLLAINKFAKEIFSRRFEIVPSFVGMLRLGDGTMDLSTMYLSLNVRREQLLLDTLRMIDEVMSTGCVEALQLPLRVTFLDEAAVDAGGVQKEYFSLCVDQFVGCMRRCGNGRLVWFENSWKAFHDLIARQNSSADQQISINFSPAYYLGVIISLAFYNGVLVGLPLPTCIYKFLTGAEQLCLADLFESDIGLASGLADLLRYTGDAGPIGEVYGLTFTASKNPLLDNSLDGESGVTQYEYVDLVDGGSDLYVEIGNRQKFVDLFVRHALYDCCKDQIDDFIRGLRVTDVTSRQSYKLLSTSTEIESYISGTHDISQDDMSLLRLSTTYKGVFTDEHKIINWFWDIVSSLSSTLKHKFLEFVTGTDRLPIGGITKLGLVVQSTAQDSSALPTSHTCFNILELPHTYESSEKLRAKLLIALEYSRGFGFA
jgi:ubiquitin-protein ligase E3 A